MPGPIGCVDMDTEVVSRSRVKLTVLTLEKLRESGMPCFRSGQVGRDRWRGGGQRSLIHHLLLAATSSGAQRLAERS